MTATTIYGTDEFGGANKLGEVYRLVPPAKSGEPWTRQTLFSFTGHQDGKFPVGGVVRMAATGWLIGATSGDELGISGVYLSKTSYPGEETGGTVYALVPPSTSTGAWREVTLAAVGRRSYPGGLAVSGTTIYGAYRAPVDNVATGGIFSISPKTAKPEAAFTAWGGKDIHYFNVFTQGLTPQPGMVIGRDGSLYGTTYVGGGSICDSKRGCGVVYRLIPGAGGSWSLKVLHTFIGGADGDRPVGWLALASNGTLYGTTYFGGVGHTECPRGCGTVFSLTTSGSYRVIYDFCGPNAQSSAGCPAGFQPSGGVTIGSDGALYGTAALGGNRTRPGGVAFRLTTSGSISVLQQFDGTYGEEPASPLALSSSGELLGTTAGGRANVPMLFALRP